ncbi:hypothetical protein L5515_000400 [Caenorhabditis briggsae]|uniref:RRM domain-containing protein n=1 Tax=Caenorhabditis briggsae TaxID=6238 RepID=A0AAE9J1D0_CAEBR|nr:hypothetical protein L5515_000400 [Caenorhabditis briggsae]
MYANGYYKKVCGKPIPVTSYTYLFLVYSEETSVIKLLHECHQEGNDLFVLVPGCREFARLQIRPWFIHNAFYISNKALNNRCIDIHRTVFVGGLPRFVTAEKIAQVFSGFGKVLLVNIDMDENYGYPKGAARVAFERDSSFNRALEKKNIKLTSIDSSKTNIEIKPYVLEDVGCDQCGGLWFNPFLDIYKQLKNSDNSSLNTWASIRQFLNPEDSSELDSAGSEARKFLSMTKSFGLDQEKTVNVLGNEYTLGPSLWYRFLPLPSFEGAFHSVDLISLKENAEKSILQNQKIESFLPMKRTNVFSNKSSYCKERQCRQYYCPSCSNKHHSGPGLHSHLTAGKQHPPRTDKNMYRFSLGI